MESSVSQTDENWFMRACHHISKAFYNADKKKSERTGTYYRGPAVCGPDNVAYVLSVPVISLCGDLQIQTKPKSLSNWQSAGQHLLVCPKRFFSPRPEPAVDGPDNKRNLEKTTRAKQKTVLPDKFNKANLFQLVQINNMIVTFHLTKIPKANNSDKIITLVIMVIAPVKELPRNIGTNSQL